MIEIDRWKYELNHVEKNSQMQTIKHESSDNKSNIYSILMFVYICYLKYIFFYPLTFLISLE